MSIGILAYGSLIEDPGKELGPVIQERIAGVETPFSVEFARSSRSRDGAPTLIPVRDGGTPVKGVILVLCPSIDICHAEDLLWRRETRRECSDRHYDATANSGPDRVEIGRIHGLANVNTVLVTKIAANIENRTPAHLADLAIRSARKEAGATRMDGISYLISVKRQDIRTPLLPDYEAAILAKTNGRTLEEAYDKVRAGDA